MPYETLLLARDGAVAVITLNRPPANAISESLIRELDAALTEIEADAAVRAVVITGAGDRIFCAGPTSARRSPAATCRSSSAPATPCCAGSSASRSR